jgi:hypothetical protein
VIFSVYVTQNKQVISTSLIAMIRFLWNDKHTINYFWDYMTYSCTILRIVYKTIVLSHYNFLTNSTISVTKLISHNKVFFFEHLFKIYFFLRTQNFYYWYEIFSCVSWYSLCHFIHYFKYLFDGLIITFINNK